MTPDTAAAGRGWTEPSRPAPDPDPGPPREPRLDPGSGAGVTKEPVLSLSKEPALSLPKGARRTMTKHDISGGLHDKT